MGKLAPKPKRPDTSRQDALIKQQQADLKAKREQAEAEAEKLRQERLAKQRAISGRAQGRRSLIATSELGTSGETLG